MVFGWVMVLFFRWRVRRSFTPNVFALDVHDRCEQYVGVRECLFACSRDVCVVCVGVSPQNLFLPAAKQRLDRVILVEHVRKTNADVLV